MEAKKQCVIFSQFYVLDQFISKYTGNIMNLCIQCPVLGTNDQEERKKGCLLICGKGVMVV